METRIRVCCPQCNEIDLTRDQIVVRATRGRNGQITDAVTYRFVCPGCDRLAVKPADMRAINLLHAAGVAMVLTSRTDVPTGRPGHPALNDDDLRSFRELLAGESWYPNLLSVIAANDQ